MCKTNTLRSAIPLFIRQGFGPTTTRGVARSAQITRSGLYRQFKTKDLLFTGAIKLLEQDFVVSLRRIAGAHARPTPSFWEALHGVVEQLSTLFRLAAVHHPEQQWTHLERLVVRIERRLGVLTPFLDASALAAGLRSIALQASATHDFKQLVKTTLQPKLRVAVEEPMGPSEGDVLWVEDFRLQLRVPGADAARPASTSNRRETSTPTARATQRAKERKRKRKRKKR